MHNIIDYKINTIVIVFIINDNIYERNSVTVTMAGKRAFTLYRVIRNLAHRVKITVF